MTVPLSPRGKYQLVVLGPEGDSKVAEYFARLNSAVNSAFNHLGVNPQKFLLRIMSGTEGAELDRRMLTVAVFSRHGVRSCTATKGFYLIV